jgi:hypothetical protein
LVADTAGFIPRIFRIMETGPVIASHRSQALTSDPDDRDDDHPGSDMGGQAVVRSCRGAGLQVKARPRFLASGVPTAARPRMPPLPAVQDSSGPAARE